MSALQAEKLEVAAVSAGYDRADIVRGVSFTAEARRITLIAGPNGAGKSTVLKVIAGSLRASAGSIRIGAREVTDLDPAERAGLAYVPQERNIFRNLSIAENLSIGFEFVHPRAGRRAYAAARDRMLALFPDLTLRLGHRAGVLSGGQRQMLAIASALIAGPTILLLDEPTAGLSPKAAMTLLDTVRAVNATGVTVLMIEQNVVDAVRVSDTVVLVVGGETRGQWPAPAFLIDPAVRTLFLHGAAREAAPLPEVRHAASAR